MDRRTFLVASCCLVLLSLTAQAAVYNGGRCDGVLNLIGGDYVQFVPGDNPQPRFLWILVQQGGGNALIQNSGGAITSALYLNTFDMLLLDAAAWTDFYFQGGSCKIYFGGANVNPPQNPICYTGTLGPTLILTDELRNVAVQSGSSGPPGIQVTSYQKVEAKVDGSMNYKLLSNLQLWGRYRATACSGAACCDPQQTTFVVKNTTGGGFTGYLLDSEDTAPFDWMMVPAPPLLCGATATPTTGTVPVTVDFKGEASGGSGDYHYAWNFGDGKSDAGESLSHTYKAGGSFTWKLTVTDAANKSCQKSGTVTFISPLTVKASVNPRQGPVPLAATFTCTPKGGRLPYSYAWLFGDGGGSDLQTPGHTYLEAGEFEALVTVTDADDKSAAASVKVYCGVPLDPTVIAVQKATNPFRLILAGTDFESGCTVYIGDTPAPVSQYKKSTKVVAKGSTLKAMLPKGVPRCITVRNPSGGTSDCFIYTR